MGIRGLLPFIDAGRENILLTSLKGKVVGVDAYVWLYKGTYCCAKYIATGTQTSVHIEYFVSRVKKLLEVGIRPILVFDGVSPKMKSWQEDLRRARKEEKLHEAELELQKDSPDLIHVNSLYKQAVSISHTDAVKAMKRCREIGVDCLVAPMESDAQLTYLQKIGLIDYIMSEDSDLLVYGHPTFTKALYKVNFDNMSAELITLEKVFTAYSKKFPDFSFHMFQTMCILAGCDYLLSIKRVGISIAYKLTKEFKEIYPILDVLRQRKYEVPASYLNDFKRCLNIFLHHSVYNPCTSSIMPLNDVPVTMDEASASDFTLKLPEKKIFDYVTGNITPSTQSYNKHFDITKTVPINVYFVNLFKARPELYIGSESDSLEVEEVEDVEGEEFNLHPGELDGIEYIKEFEVVGGRHHTPMHDSLNSAYDQYLQRNPLSVSFTLEPDNEFDSNAILVNLDFGEGPQPIGYITEECTKYLRPVLVRKENISAEVTKFMFGLRRRFVGFTLLIDVTKRGPWL